MSCSSLTFDKEQSIGRLSPASISSLLKKRYQQYHTPSTDQYHNCQDVNSADGYNCASSKTSERLSTLFRSLSNSNNNNDDESRDSGADPSLNKPRHLIRPSPISAACSNFSYCASSLKSIPKSASWQLGNITCGSVGNCRPAKDGSCRVNSTFADNLESPRSFPLHIPPTSPFAAYSVDDLSHPHKKPHYRTFDDFSVDTQPTVVKPPRCVTPVKKYSSSDHLYFRVQREHSQDSSESEDSSIDSESSNNMNPAAILMERLNEYESRGWLTRQEFTQYRSLLHRHSASKFYLSQIGRDLDKLATRNVAAENANAEHHGSSFSISPDSKASETTSNIPSTRTSLESVVSSNVSSQPASILYKKSSRRQNVSWNDKSRLAPTESPRPGGSSDSSSKSDGVDEDSRMSKQYEKSDLEREQPEPVQVSTPTTEMRASQFRMTKDSSTIAVKEAKDDNAQVNTLDRHVDDEDIVTPEFCENIEPMPKSNKLVVEPADLCNGNVEFTDSHLQELFVEMCFFARLGFVQPPCCLQCTYRESMAQGQRDANCERWVVWRKEASNALHPQKLDGNILLIQCKAARMLLNGRGVEGRFWDTSAKRIVNS